MKKQQLANNYDVAALATRAMSASVQTRLDAKIDLIKPVCIYNLCDKMGLSVRFNDINMEGMYERGAKPRIHLSALRPLVRRNFTCAHELGHHIFGHGSTIDELREENSQRPPNEFLVDTFAAFLLMPVLGIKNAFARRGIIPSMAPPCVLYSIACNFGVGYSTLIHHLAYSLNLISRERMKELSKHTPKTIRSKIMGILPSENLTVVDQYWTSATLDTEIGSHVLLPSHVVPSCSMLRLEHELETGKIFRAVASGITRAESANNDFATFVRVSKKNYAGLAKYRHLENNDDE